MSSFQTKSNAAEQCFRSQSKATACWSV